MSEWEQTTLGQIASFQNGFAFKPAHLNGSKLPVVRIKQLLDRSAPLDHTDVEVPAKQHIADGDLIFCWSGTLASVIWDRGPAVLNQHLFKVHARPGVVLAWLHYCLDNAVVDLLDKTHGTTMKHVTKKTLEAHPVVLPPLDEQHRIVDVMAAVDAQIEALETEITSARDVYANATELLWSDDGVEAPLRSLSEVMSLDVKRVNLVDDREYQLAGVLNAGQGLVDKGTLLGADSAYVAMNSLRTGQVVMRKLTAWEGPITVVPPEFDGFVASNEFPTFTLGEAVTPAWMNHVCRTPRLWDEMKNRVTGSVQRRKRLNPDQLLSVALPVPSFLQQRTVASALDELTEAGARLAREMKALQAFRSTLLSALLAQEIEIPESYDALLSTL